MALIEWLTWASLEEQICFILIHHQSSAELGGNWGDGLDSLPAFAM